MKTYKIQAQKNDCCCGSRKIEVWGEGLTEAQALKRLGKCFSYDLSFWDEAGLGCLDDDCPKDFFKGAGYYDQEGNLVALLPLEINFNYPYRDYSWVAIIEEGSLSF